MRWRKLLAWVLIEIVDPINHWLILEAGWQNWVPLRVASAIADPSYRFCQRIVDFDIKVNPGNWPKVVKMETFADYVDVYSDWDDIVELRVEWAILKAERLSGRRR